MTTKWWKRILTTVGRSFAEGMVMTDPLVYSYYLQCTAENLETQSRPAASRAATQDGQVTRHAPISLRPSATQ